MSNPCLYFGTPKKYHDKNNFNLMIIYYWYIKLDIENSHLLYVSYILLQNFRILCSSRLSYFHPTRWVYNRHRSWSDRNYLLLQPKPLQYCKHFSDWKYFSHGLFCFYSFMFTKSFQINLHEFVTFLCKIMLFNSVYWIFVI